MIFVLTAPSLILSFDQQTTREQVETELSSVKTSSQGVASLTQRLAKGDEEAFKRFHELYFDRLYRFLLVIARGREQEAREALQETLLRVVRYARPFETEEALWCWVKVLARSAARDAGRKEQRYLTLLHRFAVGWSGGFQQETGDEDQHLPGFVEESLEELDPADRALIEGKYLEEESVRELALKTGLTDKAVESRLLRLRRHLRERMLKKLRLL